MSRLIGSCALPLCALFAGCSFYARDPESYRKVTRQVLESKNTDIQGCYDTELKKDPKLGGNVVVKFTVQRETGQIVNPSVDPASTAPASLSQCVVRALVGLKIDPPDKRDGNATFRWEFQNS